MNPAQRRQQKHLVLWNCQQQEVSALFKKYDLNKNGKLNVREFGKILEAVGISGVDVHTLFKCVDTDRDGGIDMNELLGWHAVTQKALFDKFAQFDLDHNGRIDVLEFGALLEAVGNKKSDIDTVFRHVDANNNGSIDLNEFFTWLYCGRG